MKKRFVLHEEVIDLFYFKIPKIEKRSFHIVHVIIVGSIT